MRISARGRYAMAAAVSLARQVNSGACVTVLSISENLGISKIYLEQVFSLLKRGGLVTSTKGSQGGYQLSRAPDAITLLEILSAVESSLFEETESTVPDAAPDIEAALRTSAFGPLDRAIQEFLSSVTLDMLVLAADTYLSESAPMFYI